MKNKSVAWGLSESENLVLEKLIDMEKRQGRDRLGIFNVTRTARHFHADIREGLEKAEFFLEEFRESQRRILAYDALIELMYVHGLQCAISNFDEDEFVESIEDCGHYYGKYQELWKALEETFDEHINRYYSTKWGFGEGGEER